MLQLSLMSKVLGKCHIHYITATSSDSSFCQKVSQVTLKHERQIQIFGTQTKINRAIFPGIWHMIERETKPVKASKGYETTSSFKLNTPGT